MSVQKKVRKIPERKKKQLSEFVKLLRRNKYLLLVDAYKCKTIILNEARSLQNELGYTMKGGKNTILLLAIEKTHPQALEEAKKNLCGQNIFVFTNKNPFDVIFDLNELEVKIPASPGDVATSDIIIRAGNTGLPPGPIISLFSSCKVPTKIISGSIHITRDVTVAKKGDIISADLANLLRKLDIKPISAKLYFKAIIDLEKGASIPKELFEPAILERYEKQFAEASSNAFKVSIEIGYVTPENLAVLVLFSFVKAQKLAEELAYISPETLPRLLAKAINYALALSKATSSPE